MGKNVLLFYSNEETCTHLIGTYRQSPLSFTEKRTMESVKKELLSHKYQLFLSRCEYFDESQVEILDLIKKHNLKTRAVYIPKYGTVEEAVRAIKLGAGDFIVAEEVTAQIFDAMLPEEFRHNRSISNPAIINPQEPVIAEYTMVGESPAINEVRSAITMVSQSNAAVLITGESGTGKDIVARLIHQESERKNQPFIAINCAALPKDVIENELFGHEKGAFTGALNKKMGAFELANNGTLFFDEIAEMNPDTQAKLLRAIESKSFRRLGGNDEVKVDVRVVAATNKKIADAIASGHFREDLYYRFSVIEIDIPPLRNRRSDLPLLIDHFLSDFGRKYGKPKQSFSEEALKLLLAYDWPGNVRELRNIIERAMVTRSENIIESDFLPPRISKQKHPENSIVIPVGSTYNEAERILILQTLRSVKNNRSQAAKVLGLSRKTLHNKLNKYKLD
ncbi:MAG: sigma-54 dependent transcriptional regulator [Bacteroidota bacterium]